MDCHLNIKLSKSLSGLICNQLDLMIFTLLCHEEVNIVTENAKENNIKIINDQQFALTAIGRISGNRDRHN